MFQPKPPTTMAVSPDHPGCFSCGNRNPATLQVEALERSIRFTPVIGGVVGQPSRQRYRITCRRCGGSVEF